MAQYKTFSNFSDDPKAPKPESMAEVSRISCFQDRQKLINSNKIVIIDNYTDWCGPCKQCAPKFSQLAKKYTRPGMCALAKENVEDKCQSNIQIRGVPCFHFYVNGHYQEEMTITGADMNQVETTIQKLLY